MENIIKRPVYKCCIVTFVTVRGNDTADRMKDDICEYLW